MSDPGGLGLRFGTVADSYDEVRPDYPDELYDEIERIAGPLAGLDIVDLAAGTGLQTRALRRRGARLLAVDPDIGMLRRLVATSPGTPAVVARGEQLPIRADAVDLVVCATAWHWLNPSTALGQIERVLRPGGHLAMWWANHQSDDGIAWEAAQSAVFDRWDAVPGSMPLTVEGVGPRESAADLRARGLDVRLEREFTWSRVVTREQHLRVLATHSIHLVRPETERRAILGEIEAALQPWPTMTERIWGPLVIARF
jgi:SAM-dependent methyltransferase